ncbi:MAG: hypothetical protein IPK74_13715 [Deltaproteobacteria bacterium]|nr:hypothetical protein [Deltaproteobacteria bacterium]
MPTEALRCPTCGAADHSRTDAAGVNTCAYCGVRYRITGGVAARVDGRVVPQRATPVIAIAIAAVVLVGLAAGVAFALLRRGGDAVGAPGAGDAALAPTSPVVVPAADGAGPAEVPLSATFVMEHRRPSNAPTFYAIGWVTNTSEVAISQPKVTAVLHDAGGAEVGTAFGFAERDTIAPGERAPASILVMNPPPFETITFEIRPSRATYFPPRVGGLRIEHGPAQHDGYSDRITGKVFNDGNEPARFVRVEALSYAADDSLVSVDFTFADGESLAPGDAARFQINLARTDVPAARHELTVSGSPL